MSPVVWLLVLLAAPPGVAARARAAYNEGLHQQARRLFLEAIARDPRDLSLYRDLARARVWSGDIRGAVIAYDVYLAGAKQQAGQTAELKKVRAELELVERKLPQGAARPTQAAARQVLDQAQYRARSGQFAGEEGAFGALAAATEAGFLGPRLATERDAVVEQLVQQSREALERWWHPGEVATPPTLARLAAGWREVGPLASGRAEWSATLEGLSALAGDVPERAAERLAVVAAGDHRLRYALALALAKAGRWEEARQSAAAAAEQTSDPRAHLLLGLLQRETGQDPRAALLRGLGIAP